MTLKWMFMCKELNVNGMMTNINYLLKVLKIFLALDGLKTMSIDCEKVLRCF
jgi:hypothetical protein